MPIWATADSTFTAPSDDICLQQSLPVGVNETDLLHSLILFAVFSALIQLSKHTVETELDSATH